MAPSFCYKVERFCRKVANACRGCYADTGGFKDFNKKRRADRKAARILLKEELEWNSHIQTLEVYVDEAFDDMEERQKWLDYIEKTLSWGKYRGYQLRQELKSFS